MERPRNESSSFSLSLLGSLCLFTFGLLLLDSYWLLERCWLWLYVIFLWVLKHHWRVNREVGSHLILVTISHIDIHVFSLEVEIEGSWPEKGSDNDNSI